MSVFLQPINQQTCLTTVLNYTVPRSNIPAVCQPLPPATNVYGLTTSERTASQEEEWDERKEGVEVKTLLDKNRQARLRDTTQKVFCVVGRWPGRFNLYNEKQKRKQNSLLANMINLVFLE